MLGRLQRLACLAITGATRTTPTAAIEVLLGMPSLDIHIKGIAMNTCYRMNSTGSWRGSGTQTNHTRILGRMGMEIPVTKMRGDIMVPHYSFDQRYRINIASKEHWSHNDTKGG